MWLDAGCVADVLPPAGSHADNFNDNACGGLVQAFLREAHTFDRNKKFAAAVAKAVDKRTQEALNQAVYGLGPSLRHKGSASVSSSFADAALVFDNVPEPGREAYGRHRNIRPSWLQLM